MSGEKRTLGAAIFADIEDNKYLNKLHEKVLYNYALRLLQLTKKEPMTFDQKEKRDALRFADLLSKSNDPERAYEGKPVMAVHISLKNDVPDKKSVADRMQEILRQDKEIRLLPKLYKFRELFPINQAGKIDLLGMAAETDGFLVMPD